jgi:hypothetical protein
MNILYIGPYRQDDDNWGTSARSYLRALEATKFNVVSRPITMSYSAGKYVGEIPAEHRSLDAKPDVVIQHVIPPYIEYIDAHNIGIVHIETQNLNNSRWITQINVLDELWVNSRFEKNSLEKSGINIPINVVPAPLNLDSLETFNDCPDLGIHELNGNFVFYVIGEYCDRNNIIDICEAFSREFMIYENVTLLIKSFVNGFDSPGASKKILEDVFEMKKKSRLYDKKQLYQNEVVIADELNPEQMLGLHHDGDCYITAASGESVSVHALLAAYANNQIICNSRISTGDSLRHVPYYIDSHEVPVLVSVPPIKEIYTSWETWSKPSILSLQEKMREVYSHRDKPTNSVGRDLITKFFSDKTAAETIERTLEWVQ